MGLFRRKRQTVGLREKQAKTGLLFVSPFIIGLLVYFLSPMIQSLLFSFSEIKVMAGGFERIPVGFDNYVRAFSIDPNFLPELTASIITMVYQVPLIIIFSFFAATLLNRPFKGRGVARLIFFLPVIMSAGVLLAIENSSMLIGMAQENISATGDVESSALQAVHLRQLLLNSGMNRDFVTYLTDAVDGMYEIVTASGVQILVFLAGLQSVPSHLYEAAHVEGATAWESFWKITFPLVSPLILVNVVYTIVDSFTKPTNEIMTMIQNTAFETSFYGYSAAIAWIYFLVILFLLGVVAWIISRYVYLQ